MKLRTSLPAMAGAVCAPLAAWGQPVTGPYVSLGTGIDYLEPQNLHGISASILGNQIATNVGGIASGAGVRAPQNRRVKVMLNWVVGRKSQGAE